MNKKPSFFYQAKILIQRYFKIIFNDKKNLILKIAIPLMTILIVCLVACKDMFSIIPEDDHCINNGYPVLTWEMVEQEIEPEDDEADENDIIEYEKSSKSKWSGNWDKAEAPTSPAKSGDENYFLITNAEQLAFLANAVSTDNTEYLTYNYMLQCDINLNSQKFKTIGNKEHPFTGTFNGNGHIISNLKLDGEDNVALFAYVKSNIGANSDVTVKNALTGASLEMTMYHNGIVENLQIKNPSITASGNNAAAVAAVVSGQSRIKSVSVKDGKIVGKGNVGSIVGSASGDEAEIYITYSTASVAGKGGATGGLVGNLESSRLSGSYYAGKIKNSGDDNKTGSVVGKCDDKEEQIKNVFYDNELSKDYEAVSDKDIKGVSYGVETDKLADYSSFMVPYKDIMTAYDYHHMSDIDEERYDAKDYDPENDKDIDDEYGFKKDDQLAYFNGTQTGIFMLVCVAVFVGICNSIQEICKERNILKREYMTNLRLSSYVISKLVVQAVICAVQMVIVVLLFAVFLKILGRNIPDNGVMLGGIWLEVFITMFLLAFAADTLSLLISAVVKTSELANTFIPIILIVQIVFAGVLFDFSGVMEILANLMISKWGTNALAATVHLNDSQSKFLLTNPDLQLQLGSSMSIIKNQYASTAANLLITWAVLLGFIIISSVACGLLLTKVKDDKR